jgi:phosphopantothenoylcysteine decarboxylase/phosphopantothenate--cysteine ligase
MNTNMFEHETVVANLATLAARGVRFVDPGSGYLACGWIGKGRLAEPDDIVEAAQALLTPATPLRGTRMLISAGPTYEDLDPVRYIANRSSGKMGLAIAAEAAQRGAEVTLVLGPSSQTPPAGVTVARARSAAEMHAAITERAAGVDVIVMAAAVADYTAVSGPASHKIAKTSSDTLTLTLTKTRDILADLSRMRGSAVRPLLVGFAAETHDVIARARAKLQTKQVDLIVANDVSRADAGFEVDANAATLVSADGLEELPLQSKRALAGRILDRVSTLLAATPAR